MDTFFMSYRDYPQAAKKKAQLAIQRNAKLGNRCATQVGKVRAQQLAQGKPLSLNTVERTYSYLSRGKAYQNPDDPNTCGSISYDLWGGDPMLAYTRRLLKKKQECEKYKLAFPKGNITTPITINFETDCYGATHCWKEGFTKINLGYDGITDPETGVSIYASGISPLMIKFPQQSFIRSEKEAGYRLLIKGRVIITEFKYVPEPVYSSFADSAKTGKSAGAE